MKLKKAMKKLKFWSSKKTKIDTYYESYHKLPPEYDFYPYIYHSPPPPQSPPMLPPSPDGCECHFCHPAEPSAPPLPSWLEPQLQESYNSDDYFNSIDPFSNSSKNHDHCIRISQEKMVITTDTNTSGGNLQDRDKNEILDSGSSELQPSSENDVVVGLFGCIVDVSALLFRCFIPCLNISRRQSAAPLLMASADVKE